MCGFAAIVEPGRRFDPALLAGIEGDLHHRGPDSGGIVDEPGVALVLRRLAILDPSSASDQPMTDPTGRCTLVYNGEIYNYRRLRAELVAAGVPLRTDGDSEAILQGYLRWGEEVLDRLEGMYAFVIVDRERGVAVAARDPFGIKPLYLLRRGRLVALASEMRPFARLVSPEPDPEALAELLTFSWAAGRLSNLKGIERVPGGTVLTISLGDGGLRERRFCDPLETLASARSVSEQEAGERVHAALRASVKDHLASDVGYTIQLSGGVDSSLVAGLVKEAMPDRLVTFGINLGDYEHDEEPCRRMVVESFGLDHREVRITGADYGDALPRAVRHMEGPTPHGGCVCLMLLCDRIRQVSKVVLTGEGADEFFGGYERYARWPRLMWKERIAHALPARLWPDRGRLAGLRRLAGRDAAAYASLYREPEPLWRMFPNLIPKPGAREAASARFGGFLERLFACDQSAYLESLLIRQDKMSMAASVEARVPYVHLPLARVVNAISPRMRAPGGETKPMLKRVARGYLPDALIDRRKVGLRLPYDRWLADETALGRYLDDLTAANSRLAGYGEPGRIRRAVDAFRAGEARLSWILLRLVGIETWLRGLAAPAQLASGPPPARMEDRQAVAKG